MRCIRILSLIFLLVGSAKADPLPVTLGGDANIAFVTNYAAWSALSDEAKAAYAAAVFDQYIIDAPDISFIKPGDFHEQLDCVRNLKATPESIARLISNRYAKSPAERHGSPAAVLTGYLAAGDFCATLTFEMQDEAAIRPRR
jgi:hypothetical protein